MKYKYHILEEHQVYAVLNICWVILRAILNKKNKNRLFFLLSDYVILFSDSSAVASL